MTDNPTAITITDTETICSKLERQHNIYYRPDVAARILDCYIEGKSLPSIAALEGFPSYGTILRWLHTHDEFRTEFEKARTLRAINFEEKAIEAAEEPVNKDDVPQATLKVNTYKWAAETNGPERYGKKMTVQGDSTKPVVFQVISGVPENKYIKAVELDEQGVVKKDIEAEVISEEVIDG